MKIILLGILLPLLVFGQSVEIVPDWAFTSKDPLFSRLEGVLSKQGKTLAVSDLSNYAPFLDKKVKKNFSLDPSIKKIVFWNIAHKLKKLDLSRLPKERLILFMWEPPTVQKNLYTEKVQGLFSKIYTWDDDLVDNRRFFKFFYPVLKEMVKERPSFQEKKLSTMVISNKKSKHPQELYTAREAVIAFFEEKKNSDFEFYGWGWEGTKYTNYRGATADKIDVMKNYRFAYCYENIQGKRGYITEKIFDCFAAGCVPIYWGASNVEEYIPSSCFIDRRKFKSDEELYLFLKKMTEEEHKKYIANIFAWLKTEQAALFSTDHFVKTFAEAVRE